MTLSPHLHIRIGKSEKQNVNLHREITIMGDKAVAAARALARLSSEQRRIGLISMADELEARKPQIASSNAADMEAGRKCGLSPAMLDRLLLNDQRINAMIAGLRMVADLPDPVGSDIKRWTRPNGLLIIKRRVPIGVIAIIYESRPNVTADAAALCLRTANAVILRGGKEALRSNIAIAEAMSVGGARAGLPTDAIQIVRNTDHEAVKALVQLEGKVDLVIPRGGEALIRSVAEHARVPVIKHYKGVCHVYVDESADLHMAMKICENAKCQRPGVCNAMETLLVHEKIAETFLPPMCRRYMELGVELRGCPEARRIVPEMKEAVEDDWYAEYLALILAIRVVPTISDAVEHIQKYGSRHSDAIVASSSKAQEFFVSEVDSAAVYVNASTRFTDGGEFGMGAEIGISTDKIHARGPMAVEELTSYKYVVIGNGQVRS